MKEDDKYKDKDFTTENISWLIKDKIKSKILSKEYLDCDLSDENFSSYWLFEVVIDNTLYVVKSGYTHQEKPDGTYCKGIQIESKPTNFNKLPTKAERYCIDNGQIFNPDDGYFFEDIKLENLTQIESCGCAYLITSFKDGEKIDIGDYDILYLDIIEDILKNANLKYSIERYDDGWKIIIN